MKNKIKSMLLLVLTIIISTLFVACSNGNVLNDKNETKAKEKIKIATLKGPTGMGMVKLMEENQSDYEISIMDSPDQIVSKIVNGEVDGAAMPSNLASVLYNKTKGNVQLVGVNTLGVLYIAENGNTVHNIKALKGKTIYSSGKGGTPEYILNYILKKNGLDPNKDVNVEYMNQHSDLSAAVASKKINLAVLPEPFVSVTKMKDKELNIPIDLTKEWEKVSENKSKLVMGTIIFKKDFIEKNKESIDEFESKYKKSVKFVNDNAEQAGKLIEKYGILPKAKIAEMAIPKCNIVFINGLDAKKDLDQFYGELLKINPKSIGGKIPDAEFYYKGK